MLFLGGAAATGCQGNAATPGASGLPPLTLRTPPPRPPSELDDVTFLLHDVAGIPALPGASPLCVYGPDAFPVIVGGVRNAAPLLAPAVAAGRWESGRVVVFGSVEYLVYGTLTGADAGRMAANAFWWVAEDAGEAGPRIGVVDDSGLRNWLTDAGFTAVQASLTPESLGQVDVVAMLIGNQSPAEIEALSAFLRAGGGLVTAGGGGHWAYWNPDLDLVRDHPGNRLLASVGIQWSRDELDSISQEVFPASGPPPPLTHAGAALDALGAHLASQGTALTKPELDRALDSLTRAAACLPPDDTLLAPRLHAVLGTESQEYRWPSEARPVGKADLGARLASTLFVTLQRHTPAESVRAHPAAADFPGTVPVNAPRLTRTLAIDTRVPRWHSTGLYAAPGEVVTVTMPASAADGYHVRVGAHTDGIWPRPEWTRMPEITRRFPVTGVRTRVANAFGGLIYVEVPPDANLGRIDVEIAGAVAAPLFVLGETDLAAWRSEIRHAPAPWAEIAGRNMIVTTDAREVRTLDDPDAVAETWDRILDLSADLAAWPEPRSSPERFVVDRQISIGHMHSGYPLMAHLDQTENLVDVGHLRSEGNWGFFHEVGHNHQNYDWTFDGSVEVTVNLFTLYVYERLVGVPVTTTRWRGNHRTRAELLALYDFDEPDLGLWKREPFVPLIMYAQMQEAFGWNAYRRVFATYLALPDAERPRGDAEKRDQWLVRFSREVGRNLGPFFETWGVPTSQEARDSIADLPEWMPPNFPPRG
ncbi:MAG: hypothetical protein F4Y71_01755 [Acidobacteria bacterium]|nr:hypothetical protein [Acidobacteriota bacterium]